MAKILVVDDEDGILKLIRNVLIQDDHTVTACLGFDKVEEDKLLWYDLILLDIMMPGTGGFEVCRRIRGKVDCPIIFVTAKSEEEDIVYGFGLGADDYIRKPFGIQELKARIGAHLRRECRERHTVMYSGEIQFDLPAKKLMINNSAISLTKGEYNICEYLCRYRGQVFSREQIFEAVFGYDGESNDNTIVTHIKNIRAKLDDAGVSPIRTVWGIGYKWET